MSTLCVALVVGPHPLYFFRIRRLLRGCTLRTVSSWNCYSTFGRLVGCFAVLSLFGVVDFGRCFSGKAFLIGFGALCHAFSANKALDLTPIPRADRADPLS